MKGVYIPTPHDHFLHRVQLTNVSQTFTLRTTQIFLFRKGTTYEDLENLAEALKIGRAEGIIVDMYMAGFRTDLFNGSWYKVSSILNEKFYYGVNIGGGAARLAKRFQEYSTTTYEVKIKLLQQEREKKLVSNVRALYHQHIALSLHCFLLFCGEREIVLGVVDLALL